MRAGTEPGGIEFLRLSRKQFAGRTGIDIFGSNLTMNPRPIILIDDDPDDLQFMQEAIREIDQDREVIAFSEVEKFLDFISTTEQVFLFILSDINMGKINGLELKKLIYDDEHLRLKCVPFIFLSTTSAPASVEEAYSYNVQGFFIKPSSVAGISTMLQSIITYWSASERPNSGKSSEQ